MVLSPGNTAVHFRVDSTWHKIEGIAKQLQGNITLTSTGGVSGEVAFAVASFDTDNGLRDEKLRSIMAEDRFPRVTFRPQAYSGDCALPAAGKVCTGKLQGLIQIRDVQKNIELDIVTTGEDSQSVIAGHSTLQWRDFGVEDPSMFVARLADDVNIDVKIRMKITAVSGKEL